MQKWEYFVTSTETSLYALGEQGWELVSVIPSQSSWGPPATFYFKRPKKDD
jgi:hypothetical protein